MTTAESHTQKLIWQNGSFVPWSEAKSHVLSHSLHYGGGVFEGIRVYATKQGPAIFKLEEHVDRLLYSANALKIPLPYAKEELISAIKNTVRMNELQYGYVRPIAYYGEGHLRLDPGNLPVEVVIACWPWGAYLPHESIDIKTSSFIRIHPKSTVADAKICGHYVNSILAVLELRGTRYHEALLLDASGYIAEGPGENFFIVKNNNIFTPKLGTILSGITRNTIMNLAHSLNYEVIETDLTLEDAYKADEAFFTGTAAEVSPIRTIDDKEIGTKDVGPITKILRDAYLDIVSGKNERYLHDLTFV